jgi:hypothetical protein
MCARGTSLGPLLLVGLDGVPGLGPVRLGSSLCPLILRAGRLQNAFDLISRDWLRAARPPGRRKVFALHALDAFATLRLVGEPSTAVDEHAVIEQDRDHLAAGDHLPTDAASHEGGVGEDLLEGPPAKGLGCVLALAALDRIGQRGLDKLPVLGGAQWIAQAARTSLRLPSPGPRSKDVRDVDPATGLLRVMRRTA